MAKKEESPAQMESEGTATIHFHLSTENSNVTRSDYLLHEFQHVFRNEPVEAIDFAFRQHRNRTAEFPAISDIRYGIDYWHRLQRGNERAEIRRSAGETEGDA